MIKIVNDLFIKTESYLSITKWGNGGKKKNTGLEGNVGNDFMIG